MQGEVEICGINTAKLKVLSSAETQQLLLKCQQGDKKAREELIQGNLRLVLSVVQRFVGRGESADDLFQVGCVGLIKSIDHFDTTLNVRFSTYAVPMIIGEIRRYLRDNSAVRVSRSLRDSAYKALTAREKFTSEHQREPTVEEIAHMLGIEAGRSGLCPRRHCRPDLFVRPHLSRGGRRHLRDGPNARPQKHR